MRNPSLLSFAAVLSAFTALAGGGSPGKLSVMAWNTEHYGFWTRPPEVRAQIESNMFAVVKAVDPDVLLVVETYGSFDRFRAALPDRHARLLGACNSVFSRYPIVKVHDTYREKKLYGCTNGWDYAGDTGPFHFAVAELDVKGRRVRVCPIAMNWEPYPTALPDDLDAAGLLAAEAGPQRNGGTPRPQAIADILASIRPLLAETDEIPLVIGGDFNSHSHLDWTAATADHFGHRGRTVAWPVSKTMLDAGFTDTYRALHPDPISNYGTTFMRMRPWDAKTPIYARIDFIYSKGAGLEPVRSEAFNGPYHEPFTFKGERYTCFPSDHAFLVTEFRLSANPVPPAPKLPSFSETALSPALKDEIRRETPGRLAALKARMDGLWGTIRAEMPEETFQYVRNMKRHEIADRLFALAEKELARGNTDGLAFAFLYTEDLKRFCALFDEEIRWWRTYPTAPGVKPTVIRVADYGAKGDNRTDSIPAFDAAVAAAVKLAGKPCVIEIPEGDFRFSPTNRRTHLNLAGVTNCVLRGVSPERTRLWFDDMDTCGTMISDAVNATIENVDLASSRTPFFQGVVREFDKAGGWAIVQQEPGTMRPDDEIFLKGEKMGFCLGIFDEEGHEALKDGWIELFYDRRADDLGDGRFRIHFQTDHFVYRRPNTRLRPGWNVVIPARKGFCQNAGTGKGAYLCNYANVWVRNGRGSSIAFCSGGQYSTAWRVHLKPLRKGLFTSSCADAIMNYRGTFIGECTFEQMNDDGANCHGLGRRIQRIENGDTVIADWLPGNYAAGDPMLIQSGQTGQYLYLGRVKRPGKDLRGGWIHNTTFEERLPDGIRTLENLKAKDLTREERVQQMVAGKRPDADRLPDLLYRPYLFGVGHVVYRTRFSSLRGSGAVLMCPNVLLDETTYEYMNRGVALTSLGHCGEGPSPYNVWIRNCTFRDCLVGIEGRVITATGRFADTAPVRGLKLEGCRFERVGKPLMLTNVGDDAEIGSPLAGAVP